MGLPWTRKAILVLLGLALFLPTAYGQLNNLELLESPNSSEPPPGSQSKPTNSLPPTARIEGPSSPVVLTENSSSFDVTFYIPEGFYQSKQQDFFTVSAPDSSPFTVTAVNYPVGVADPDQTGEVKYYDSATLTVQISTREDLDAGEYRIPFTASYQLCDEAGTCFFPQDETILVQFEVPQDIEAAAQDISALGAPSSAAPVSLGILLRFLLFALIGGLLLNVMPCVLPVLSIRALNLVKQSGNSRREIFTGSLFYTIGVLVSLLILAGVVIGLKLSGELVGWGFQFQNPGFVVFLITVVFVFALSLFDVFVFQPPRMNGAIQRAGSKGYIGSFFNGIIAVLLATPCTAPLLGPALGFAFSQPPIVIVLTFSMVGIGFALPFLLIGLRPSLINKLPKPGPWMNTFKELMGFVLFATALYLLSILRHQVTPGQLVQVLLFLLIIGFLLWIYGKTASPVISRKRKWIILGLIVILSVSAAGRLLEFENGPNTQATATIREGWEQFSVEKLEEYQQADNPVLVVFSAKWCTVCKLNEQTVLHTERGDTLFRSKNVKLLYGDYTNQDPVIEEWIRFYGRAGVPVYAYYHSGEDYTLLPEVLTFQILENHLNPSS
ncbi:MAG: thioredoxin family protein [Spirochaetaceae bacterium]|nr:thioredoxin family protein [Spirochaetaceae bacterium]MCF7948718.1 thioredoxin family protein [Spirochaetia bacterium]MCF7951140.1 thioredoxin family protein [Spirochaetaceae bacterium]